MSKIDEHIAYLIRDLLIETKNTTFHELIAKITRESCKDSYDLLALLKKQDDLIPQDLLKNLLSKENDDCISLLRCTKSIDGKLLESLLDKIEFITDESSNLYLENWPSLSDLAKVICFFNL